MSSNSSPDGQRAAKEFAKTLRLRRCTCGGTMPTVTCSNPDTKFTGTVDSDGHLVRLGGTGRRTFHATGHEFVCVFKKDGSEGGISISVSAAGTNLGSSSIATKYGGVRAAIVRTAKEHREAFTAVPDAR